MTEAISSWRPERRFRAMVRELKALSAGELRMLGIPAAEINRLALEASRPLVKTRRARATCGLNESRPNGSGRPVFARVEERA